MRSVEDLKSTIRGNLTGPSLASIAAETVEVRPTRGEQNTSEVVLRTAQAPVTAEAARKEKKQLHRELSPEKNRARICSRQYLRYRR